MEVVLVHPEIPQNTGSIARTCAATRTPLHLIEPMKFTINEKNVRRAGLDYWPYVNVTVHPSWEHFVSHYLPSYSLPHYSLQGSSPTSPLAPPQNLQSGHLESPPSGRTTESLVDPNPPGERTSSEIGDPLVHPYAIWCVEEFGEMAYDEATFGHNDILLFGPETRGLSSDFIATIPHARTIAIPMAEPQVRSLNLSNAVAIVLYEARRQLRLDRPFFARPPK